MELVELNEESISEKDKEILRTYKEIRSKNLHKMNPIPIFKKI
jgi:hypothetical protein